MKTPAAGKISGILMDVESETFGEKSVIKVFVKSGNEILEFEDKKFKPYFYIITDDSKKAIEEIEKMKFSDNSRILNAMEVEKQPELGKFSGKKTVKLEFQSTNSLTTAREELKEKPFVLERREYDIPFAKRYLIDKQLEPMNGIELEFSEKNAIESIKTIQSSEIEFKIGSFDLETFAEGHFSDPERDPIILISYVDRFEKIVYTTRKEIAHLKYIQIVETEKEMLEKLVEKILEKKLDIIVTYNGDNFDFPYIKGRAKKFGLKLPFSSDKSEPYIKRKGLDNAAKLKGVQHLDAYQLILLLSRLSVIGLVKYDLESVHETLFGEKKEKITHEQINQIWKTGIGLENLAAYNRDDSDSALKISTKYLPILIELCRIARQTLFEANRSSASMLVEYLLINKCFETNSLIPNKPDESAVKQRTMQTYEGGFVREPKPGLHENLAVLDFSSLHPTIMISHNISPDTLECGHEECMKNMAPSKNYFCTKKDGFLSSVLRQLLETRMKLKKELKQLEKGTQKFELINARQHALKILLNSHYGYLGYPRSRWYSRECARAVTAYSKHYVLEIGTKAETKGFEVLYGDSITAGRFVTIMNPQGLIEVKNIEKLFKEIKLFPIQRNGKEVKTAKGFKALSINPKTFESEWQPIKEIIRHKTGKKIFRINQKFGETEATEDHSLLVKNGTRLREIRAKQLKQPLFKIKKIPTARQISKIDLFEELSPYFYETLYKGRIKISQIKKSGNHVTFGFMRQKKPVKLKRFIKVNSPEFNALCRLLGTYIAEGSSSTPETAKSRNGVSIASSDVSWLESLQKDYYLLFENAKAKIIKSSKGIRNLTYKSGEKTKTINYEDRTHKLQMMNNLAAVFFKMLCGQKSDGKKLPKLIFNVPDKFKKILLEEYLKGDGSRKVNERLGYTEDYKRKNFSLTTNSLEAVSGFDLLLSQLEINHTINYRVEKKAYTIKTSTNYNSRLETKITEEKYPGYVYDLSVEKNNNFVDSCGQILLHNTDSCMLKIPAGKTQKDVEEFVLEINKSLPGVMQLDLENFYKRGIFVTKKGNDKAAKKRYALIDFKGNLKIVGFEYVRRDWSSIAKETQRSVIDTILKEGKPEKAIEIVSQKIKELKNGLVPKSQLSILTQLKRPLNKYESIGPHVAAAKKAVQRGKVLEVGDVLSFIITKTGKSISDKAELEEYVKEGNYDPDYYIKHQVVPAISKILGEFGLSEDDIIHGGKQQTLFGKF